MSRFRPSFTTYAGPWPEERKRLLRELLARGGMSYGTMAAKLHVTRNAIAGMVRRLREEEARKPENLGRELRR